MGEKIKNILFFLFAGLIILFIGLIVFSSIRNQYLKIKQEKINEIFTKQDSIIQKTEEKQNELKNGNELEKVKENNVFQNRNDFYEKDLTDEAKEILNQQNKKYVEKYSSLTENYAIKKLITILFIDNDWKIKEVTFDKDKIKKEDVGKINRKVGYTFPEIKEIYVCENEYLYGEISQANIFFHELGHVFHFEYMNISSDEEFLLLYEKHKENYSKINSQVNLSHVKSSPEEFFADIFCEYCMDETAFKELYPELHNFIDKNITKIINEKILDEITSNQGFCFIFY